MPALASKCEDNFTTAFSRITDQIEVAKTEIQSIRNDIENRIVDIQNRINEWQNEISTIKYEQQEVSLRPLLIQSIDVLYLDRLSVRDFLKLKEVRTLGDLAVKTRNELMQVHEIGKESVDNIESELKKRGLALGMRIKSWPLTLEEAIVLEINVLNLSNRINRIFSSEGIFYIGDLIQYEQTGLLKFQSFGITDLNEVMTKLKVLSDHLNINLSLGMHIQNWENLRLQQNASSSEQESVSNKPELSESERAEPSEQVESSERVRQPVYFPTRKRRGIIFFTQSTLDALIDHGISNLAHLIRYTEHELLDLSGFQRVNVDEIKKKIEEIDLSLGINHRDMFDPSVHSGGISLHEDFIQWTEAFVQTEEKISEGKSKTRAIITDRDSLHSVLDSRLDSLNLSSSVQNVFKEMDFKYVGDVLPFSAEDLMSLGNFGSASLNEFKDVLSGLGVHLEMDIKDWSSPMFAISPSPPAEQRVSDEEESHQISEEGGSRDALIKMSNSVYYTPEFDRWLNKKSNLQFEHKSKIVSIVKRFENEGKKGLGQQGINWKHLRSGLRQLKLKQRANVVVYFTIVSDVLYMLDGDRIVDGSHKRTHQILKAGKLIAKYRL